MQKNDFNLRLKKMMLFVAIILSVLSSHAHTSVYDDMIAVSPVHSSLCIAIIALGLEKAPQNSSSSFVNMNFTNENFDKLSIVSYDGGTALQTSLNSNESQIDIQGLSSGQYIIRMEGVSSFLTKHLLITSNE